MVKVNQSVLMTIDKYMKVTGAMIKGMVKAHRQNMVKRMSESGRMIKRMVKVQ